MNAMLGSSHRGMFIVIEGGDSAGKHTQATLLLKHLQLQQKEIELLSFPKYDTPFGSLIAKYLRGEYGALDEIPPEIPSLLYALDRYQVKDILDQGLAAGKWFIADRYTQSNLGHQGAKLAGDERNRFISWIETLESRLPQPNLVIYLHVPVEVTQELMKTREHKKYMEADRNQDIHEVDIPYQERVIDTYLELAAARDNWVVINCVDQNNNTLRSIERIHHDIIQVVNKKFGL